MQQLQLLIQLIASEQWAAAHDLLDVDPHHVYSDAVVTTGIHAVCFLYVSGVAESVIWLPEVVVNVWLAKLTVT